MSNLHNLSDDGQRILLTSIQTARLNYRLGAVRYDYQHGGMPLSEAIKAGFGMIECEFDHNNAELFLPFEYSRSVCERMSQFVLSLALRGDSDNDQEN